MDRVSASKILTIDVVEHGIHQSQTVCVMDQLTTGECLFPFKLRLVCIQIVKIVGVFFDIPMGGDHKAESAAGRVVAPLSGLGFISRVITSMRTRG